MTILTCALLLFLIAALASAEKSPPRKALPPPCEVQCLEAKLAASEKKSVKRLKGWRRMERKRNQWKVRAKRLEEVLHPAVRPTTAVRVSGGVKGVICSVFGAHCSEALRVSWCESRWNIYARNGQYLGLFQMGSYARARYGHGWDALTQSRAAYRYYLDAGWSPWACKP